MDVGGSKRVVVDEDRIYFPATDGFIYCVQKSSGKIVWQFEMDGGVPTQLAVTDQLVIMGSSFQYLYALNKKTGKPLYRYNVGNGSGFHGAPAFDPASQQVYILSGAGNLFDFEIRKAALKQYPHGKADPYRFLDFSVR
jgi:outer membrane protein assembly factor BamB